MYSCKHLCCKDLRSGDTLPLPLQESYHAACTHVMEPIMESSHLLHPAKVWEDISHRLYSTFWSLSLYDLYVPTGRYEDEINHAKQASRDVESNSDMVI